MPALAELSEIELRKHLLELERSLHQESSLFAEYLLVKGILTSREPGGRPLYAGVGTIIEAIELCFDVKDRAMTKQQVFEELMLGGFPMKPSSGRSLVGNTLNYHARTGRLQRHGDLFGKKVWHADRFIEDKR